MDLPKFHKLGSIGLLMGRSADPKADTFKFGACQDPTKRNANFVWADPFDVSVDARAETSEGHRLSNVGNLLQCEARTTGAYAEDFRWKRYIPEHEFYGKPRGIPSVSVTHFDPPDRLRFTILQRC